MWTLENRCALRASDESTVSPNAALNAVQRARAIPLDGSGIFGDIFVELYTIVDRPEGELRGQIQYPSSGFVISKEFAATGGVEGLATMCHSCPANSDASKIARCAGFLGQPPSQEIERRLREVIARQNLEEAVKANFPRTAWRWYALWAVSPVPRAALPVLRSLLAALLAEEQTEARIPDHAAPLTISGLSDFVRAIDTAIQRNWPLRVELLPPGHVDFGFHTVFPHCPFCHAAAPVAPWTRYPKQIHTCAVCQTQYSPQATASSKRMPDDDDELRDLLSPEEFSQFAKNYLVAHGETPEAAENIVLATEAKELRRAEEWRQELATHQRSKNFVQTHILQGLPCLPTPPSDVSEGEPLETKNTGWYNAETMREIFRRCDCIGVQVITLIHTSADGECDRHHMGLLPSPLNLLSQWQSEGCNDDFYARYRADAATIDRSLEPK